MTSTEDLIAGIVARTRPVRAIRHPLWRAFGWLAAATCVIALLGIEHGTRPDLAARLGRPDFLIAVGAALATGALAAVGCLMASLPDRSRAWLLLPAPALVLWLSTIGYGCLTDWVRLDDGSVRAGEALRCFATLLLVSLPLSAAMFAMLRHAARLRPAAVTCVAGLAVAAITSAAMSLLHPLDATVMVLVWNLGAAALIVAIEGAAGARILRWFTRAPDL